jgi:hypothetical protein
MKPARDQGFIGFSGEEVLMSAIPLGIFIATMVSHMRVLGVRAAGESIAFLGGMGTCVAGLCGSAFLSH